MPQNEPTKRVATYQHLGRQDRMRSRDAHWRATPTTTDFRSQSVSLSLNKLNRTHKQRRSVCGAERETDRQTEEKERRRGLPLGTVPGPFGPGTIRAVPVKDISYNHYDDKHEQFDFSFYGLVVIDSTLEGLTKVRSRLASLLWCLAALLPVPKSTLSLALSLSTQEAVESRLSYRSFGFCFELS